jgi:hypothetical protein
MVARWSPDGTIGSVGAARRAIAEVCARVARMSRAWYQLALAPLDASASSTGASIEVVAAQGDHLGDAIAVAEKSHPRRAVVGARLCSAAPLGDSVGKSRNVVEQTATTALTASAFRWPAGVVPELAALEPAAVEARRSAEPRPGYTALREPPPVPGQPELSVLEVQVGAAELGEVFLGWVEKLPYADNLEVRLLHHFEDHGTTEVWLTPRIGVKQIIRFLDAHDRELIDNGFVELAVYLRKEGSTLRLTEHKTLEWISVDPSTVARTEQTLKSLGVRRLDELVRFSATPHFHVRQPGSKDRASLGKYLLKQRLRLVDRLDRHGVSQPAPAKS